jgi:hypothetical protein
MSGAQHLLAIAAILLLTTLILNVHRSTGEKILVTYTNESVITGTGVAQSIMDEITVKAFDENTVFHPVFVADSLTAINSLGTDLNEYLRTDYDDVDDYKNFQETVTTDRMGEFNVKVSVVYVDPNNLENVSSVTTFTKRIKVMVTNFNLPDTIRLSQIVGY